MYLVDTNIWAERLLEQERAEEVGHFLDAVDTGQLAVTDFSFHSIGLILRKLRKHEALQQFVQDAFVNGAVSLVHVLPADTDKVVLITRALSGSSRGT